MKRAGQNFLGWLLLGPIIGFVAAGFGLGWERSLMLGILGTSTVASTCLCHPYRAVAPWILSIALLAACGLYAFSTWQANESDDTPWHVAGALIFAMTMSYIYDYSDVKNERHRIASGKPARVRARNADD